MSAVLGIARREVHERRFLLGAAAALSLIALGLRMLPGPWPKNVGESLALVLVLAFPAGAALAVGSSLIGRDLAERRLSFYFSRPLSAGSLWAGKFLGGATLVSGAFLCCYLQMALGWLRDGLSVDPRAGGLLLLVCLGLMGLAHAAVTMYRSGARLFAFDLAVAAVFAALVAAQIRHLMAAGAGHAVLDVAAPAAVVAVAIVTAGAAAAQLLYGGADARRGHRALSAAMWTLAFTALGMLALWGRWVLAVTPAEVGGAGYPVLAAPRGSAIAFKGPSPGRAGFSPVFLMDGRSGSYVRLPPERVSLPAFTADGGSAVWVAPAAPWWSLVVYPRDVVAFAEHGTSLALAVARLDRGSPTIQEWPLEPPDSPSWALAVDDEGRRAVVTGRSSVSLVDTADGRVLGRLRLTDVRAADFLAGGDVRLYLNETDAAGRGAFVVVDWSARDGARVERARLSGDSVRSRLLARRGELAVVWTGGGRALVDAGRGTARRLEPALSDMPGPALVLSSGQVALGRRDEVRIVTPGGDTVARIPIDGRMHPEVLRETAPGELAFGLSTPSLDERRTRFFDAATGALRREEPGLLPADSGLEGLHPQPEPGSFASRLFIDAGGALVALDPDGRRRTLVP